MRVDKEVGFYEFAVEGFNFPHSTFLMHKEMYLEFLTRSRDEISDTSVAKSGSNGIRASDVVTLDEDVGDSALTSDSQELSLNLRATSNLQQRSRKPKIDVRNRFCYLGV